MGKRENASPATDANLRNAEKQDKFIRVAQVLNRMDSGGIEAVVLNYYRHIDRDKVQFDFYFAEGSSLPQREELERLGAGLYPIPAYSHLVAYHKALYIAFKQHGYRIVHAHLSTMSLFPLFAAWRAGVPVRICHNHSTAHWGEGVKTLLKYILRPFNKLFATDWFACGEKTGRWMYGDKAFDAGKVTIMPNAIDTAKFAYDAEARVDLREELGIPQDAFVVGHVGRFTYAKNHSFLVKVFTELYKQKPKAHLLLIGEGELKEQIRQQVQALGLQDKVIFTGARQDVNKLYSVMDVFCLPSFYEGMPLVAWEAQANGLPCVLADTMSKEAAQNSRVPFLMLHTVPSVWATTILTETKREKIAVIDIYEYAVHMTEFYTETFKRKR
ncbi:MAG: glycosyltransferase family 1 protein [Subdoligranulum sp.]|nr:glycosyltransferase family 1 protein [Subdoligranulum sp.]